ncbi:hypothetical protein STEG23_033569, partial [Scotinomys teguina]
MRTVWTCVTDTQYRQCGPAQCTQIHNTDSVDLRPVHTDTQYSVDLNSAHRYTVQTVWTSPVHTDTVSVDSTDSSWCSFPTSPAESTMVLGRKHMLTPSSRWRKDEMEQVQKQAHCFFADNISEDDPFLLYATLSSGNHCKFITKDLMRDHKACLPDARTQHLFFKWQQGHQLAIMKGFKRSKVTFQKSEDNLRSQFSLLPMWVLGVRKFYYCVWVHVSQCTKCCSVDSFVESVLSFCIIMSVLGTELKSV